MERWKEKGGSIFSDDSMISFMKNAVIGSALSGKAAIHELWIDGSLASQMICLEDGDIMRGYRIGMSDKFAEYSPGNLISIYAMSRAKKEGFIVFDFGLGPEEYKYRLGAKDRPLVRIQAKRGMISAFAKMSSLPLVNKVIDRTGMKSQALRAMHE